MRYLLGLAMMIYLCYVKFNKLTICQTSLAVRATTNMRVIFIIIMDFIHSIGGMAVDLLTTGFNFFGIGGTMAFQEAAQKGVSWLGADQYDPQSVDRTNTQTVTNVASVTAAASLVGKDTKNAFMASSAAQIYGRNAGLKNKSIDAMSVYAATQSQRTIKKSGQMAGLISLVMGTSAGAYVGMFYLLPAPIRNHILKMSGKIITHGVPLVFSTGKNLFKSALSKITQSNAIRQIFTQKSSGVWVGKLKPGTSISQQLKKLSYSQFFLAVMCQGAVYVLRYDQIDKRDPLSLKKIRIQLQTEQDIEHKFKWQWTGLLKRDPEQFIKYFQTHKKLKITIDNIHLVMRQLALFATDRQTLQWALYPFYSGQVKSEMKKKRIADHFSSKMNKQDNVIAFRDPKALQQFQKKISSQIQDKQAQKQAELEEMRQQIYQADDD